VGLEVYYPTDIRNALLAAEQAANATAKAVRPAHDGAIGNPQSRTSPETGQDDPFSAGFLTGYRAALTTLALAFGLTAHPEPSLPERRTTLLAASPFLRRR
jgi:hypothetical protein